VMICPFEDREQLFALFGTIDVAEALIT